MELMWGRLQQINWGFSLAGVLLLGCLVMFLVWLEGFGSGGFWFGWGQGNGGVGVFWFGVGGVLGVVFILSEKENLKYQD